MDEPGSLYPADSLAIIVGTGEGSQAYATIWVQGVEMAGIVVQTDEYFRWFAEQATQGELPAHWTADDRPIVEIGLAAILSRPADRLICLKDAEVRRGPRSEWLRYPYILVDIAQVGACTLGIATPGD